MAQPIQSMFSQVMSMFRSPTKAEIVVDSTNASVRDSASRDKRILSPRSQVASSSRRMGSELSPRSPVSNVRAKSEPDLMYGQPFCSSTVAEDTSVGERWKRPVVVNRIEKKKIAVVNSETHRAVVNSETHRDDRWPVSVSDCKDSVAVACRRSRSQPYVSSLLPATTRIKVKLKPKVSTVTNRGDTLPLRSVQPLVKNVRKVCPKESPTTTRNVPGVKYYRSITIPRKKGRHEHLESTAFSGIRLTRRSDLTEQSNRSSVRLAPAPLRRTRTSHSSSRAGYKFGAWNSLAKVTTASPKRKKKSLTLPSAAARASNLPFGQTSTFSPVTPKSKGQKRNSSSSVCGSHSESAKRTQSASPRKSSPALDSRRQDICSSSSTSITWPRRSNFSGNTRNELFFVPITKPSDNKDAKTISPTRTRLRRRQGLATATPQASSDLHANISSYPRKPSTESKDMSKAVALSQRNSARRVKEPSASSRLIIPDSRSNDSVVASRLIIPDSHSNDFVVASRLMNPARLSNDSVIASRLIIPAHRSNDSGSESLPRPPDVPSRNSAFRPRQKSCPYSTRAERLQQSHVYLFSEEHKRQTKCIKTTKVNNVLKRYQKTQSSQVSTTFTCSNGDEITLAIAQGREVTVAYGSCMEPADSPAGSIASSEECNSLHSATEWRSEENLHSEGSKMLSMKGIEERSKLCLPFSGLSPAPGAISLLNPEDNCNRECVVCQDRVKCVLVLPCRHLCMCNFCALRITGRPPSSRGCCPVCRGHILQTMNIFT